jgi:hypothetical protein
MLAYLGRTDFKRRALPNIVRTFSSASGFGPAGDAIAQKEDGVLVFPGPFEGSLQTDLAFRNDRFGPM